MEESPHALAEEKLTLSGEYEVLSEELSKIHQVKPRVWTEIRPTVKSTKEADMLWDMSDLGQREMKIKSRLKAIEKRTSGISTMLRVLEIEAKQQGF